MPRLLVNIDVPDLAAAEAFYTQALGFGIGRRLGGGGTELTGGAVPLYLLPCPAGTRADADAAGQRDYARHWTPVHLDIVVEDIVAAAARVQAAGGVAEGGIREAAYGRIATFADPSGHGLCLIEFNAEGYDAIAD